MLQKWRDWDLEEFGNIWVGAVRDSVAWADGWFEFPRSCVVQCIRPLCWAPCATWMPCPGEVGAWVLLPIGFFLDSVGASHSALVSGRCWLVTSLTSSHYLFNSSRLKGHEGEYIKLASETKIHDCLFLLPLGCEVESWIKHVNQPLQQCSGRRIWGVSEVRQGSPPRKVDKGYVWHLAN